MLMVRCSAIDGKYAGLFLALMSMMLLGTPLYADGPRLTCEIFDAQEYKQIHLATNYDGSIKVCDRFAGSDKESRITYYSDVELLESQVCVYSEYNLSKELNSEIYKVGDEILQSMAFANSGICPEQFSAAYSLIPPEIEQTKRVELFSFIVNTFQEISSGERDVSEFLSGVSFLDTLLSASYSEFQFLLKKSVEDGNPKGWMTGFSPLDEAGMKFMIHYRDEINNWTLWSKILDGRLVITRVI